jgi:hypothetical protein
VGYEASFSPEATSGRQFEISPDRLPLPPPAPQVHEHHLSLTSVDAVPLDLPSVRQSVRYLSTTLGLSVSQLHNLINTLNAGLNPICHLLALLEARHILHVSRIRVNAHRLNAFSLRLYIKSVLPIACDVTCASYSGPHRKHRYCDYQTVPLPKNTVATAFKVMCRY